MSVEAALSHVQAGSLPGVRNSYLAAAYDPMQGMLGWAAEVGLPLPRLPAA